MSKGSRRSEFARTRRLLEFGRSRFSAHHALDERGLLAEQPSDVYSWIANEWQFPMYGLDLSKIKVDLEALRERQRNWAPDWY